MENQMLILRDQPELSMGIDQVSLLKKVFLQKDPNMIKKLTKRIFKTFNQSTYE